MKLRRRRVEAAKVAAGADLREAADVAGGGDVGAGRGDVRRFPVAQAA
ncbi:MAG: hypothetical protein NUV72_02735 [Bauldia sp.]|nr:hypothetical protein [Bauldia sp.]